MLFQFPIFIKKNPSDSKSNSKFNRKNPTLSTSQTKIKRNENYSQEPKKSISTNSTFTAISSMRNSIAVIGKKKELQFKLGSKQRNQDLDINVLSFSQNQDNL